MKETVRKSGEMKEKEKDDKNIQTLRQEIDTVDDGILELLNRRARIVQEVGKVKSEIQMGYYSPQREREILRRLEAQNLGPFPQRAISPVFREIISACRALQTKITVAFLGPPATFSQVACIQHFGSSVQMAPENMIQDVFEAVEKGKTFYGVVPIENSTAGSVGRTFDMFIESDVRICGEIVMKISHDLLSLSGRAEEVRKIYSHPQALGQCREWLRKNFPHVQLEESASTTKAAQVAAKDSEAAAIAGSLAADLYGLKEIASQIEDSLNNYTRFLVLGRQWAEKTGRDKTSVLFSVSHAPGTLFQILQVFYEKGINLTKIESRPTKGKPWEYVFFVDFEGHAADVDVAEALDKLKKQVLFSKILGSYPQSSQEK